MVRITASKVNDPENDHIHKISLVDLQKRFKVDISNGLSSSRAQELLKTRRLNNYKQTTSAYLNALRISILVLIDVFQLTSWLSFICLLLYYYPIGGDSPNLSNLIGAGLILACLLALSFVVGINEFRILKLGQKVKEEEENSFSVLRDSNWIKVPSNELVIGDVVEITSNQYVPVDLRLISVNNLSFDRSIITGNTEFVDAYLNDFENTNYFEAKNMAFKNFRVVCGSGRGIVVSFSSDEDRNKSDMNVTFIAPTSNPTRKAFIQLALGTLFASFALIVIYLIVWASYLRSTYNLPLNIVVSNVFNIIITGVPFSFPVSILTAMLINIKEIKKLHVSVRKRFILGSMNSIDVVLTDKSGTLTKNEFEVSNAFFGQTRIDCGKSLRSHSNAFDRFINIIKVGYKANSENSIERVINRFFSKFQYHSIEARNPKCPYELVEKIEFTSANMYQATLFQQKRVRSHINLLNSDEENSDNDQVELVINGIAEILLPKCKFTVQGKDGDVVEFEEAGLNKIQQRIDKWALSGRKVICFCKKTIDKETFEKAKENKKYTFQRWFNSEFSNLTFVGIIGLMDPPRPGIKDTVNQIIELGLRVIMVTGDYSLTSIPLAIESGIFSSKNYDTLVKFRQNKSKAIATEFSYTRRILLNGAEIESLSKEELDLIYSEYYQMIICRATPNHKLQLVKLLQANSHSVLMVGDGLNDVSALKQADQSVAMNCGSKLAEETANIVLLNNSFGSIYDLLFMGRKYSLNSQRAFIFTLAGVFIQYATSFPSSVLGLPQLHSNFQMIVFSTLIDFLPTLSLIYEKPDFKSIKSAGKKKILNIRIIMFGFFLGLLTVIFAYIVYFFYLIKYAGIPMSSLIFSSFGDPSVYSNPDFIVAQSIGFYTIVIIHVFGNLYTVRTMHKSTFEAVPFFGTYSNLLLVFCSLLVAVFMILIVTFPVPRLTVNIMQLFYAIPLVESLMIILIVEGLKFIIFRKKIHPFNG